MCIQIAISPCVLNGKWKFSVLHQFWHFFSILHCDLIFKTIQNSYHQKACKISYLAFYGQVFGIQYKVVPDLGSSKLAIVCVPFLNYIAYGRKKLKNGQISFSYFAVINWKFLQKIIFLSISRLLFSKSRKKNEYYSEIRKIIFFSRHPINRHIAMPIPRVDCQEWLPRHTKQTFANRNLTSGQGVLSHPHE